METKKTFSSVTKTPQASGVQKRVAINKVPFSWHHQQKKSLSKQLYRAIHLERCNPDYQVKYPSEHRENSECKVLAECHQEAQKRIQHDHLARIERVTPPAVERPKRLNKNG